MTTSSTATATPAVSASSAASSRRDRHATLSNSASWSPPGSTTSPVLRIFTRATMPRMTATYSDEAAERRACPRGSVHGVVLDEHREVPDRVQPHGDDQRAGEPAGDVVGEPDGEGEHDLLQRAGRRSVRRTRWARGADRRWRRRTPTPTSRASSRDRRRWRGHGSGAPRRTRRAACRSPATGRRCRHRRSRPTSWSPGWRRRRASSSAGMIHIHPLPTLRGSWMAGFHQPSTVVTIDQVDGAEADGEDDALLDVLDRVADLVVLQAGRPPTRRTPRPGSRGSRRWPRGQRA